LEWGQQNKKTTKFVIAKAEGKDHDKKYTVDFYVEDDKVSTASGTSIKRAEESAAQKAYKEFI
jgi:ribonuclease-3